MPSNPASSCPTCLTRLIAAPKKRKKRKKISARHGPARASASIGNTRRGPRRRGRCARRRCPSAAPGSLPGTNNTHVRVRPGPREAALGRRRAETGRMTRQRSLLSEATRSWYHEARWVSAGHGALETNKH
eukprot:2807759-Rhodomonas_salina.1